MYTLKKSLGQHFLTDESICKQIAAAVLAENPKQLLEIGAGAGAITKYFYRIKNLDFKAVELDAEKVAYLHSNFPKIVGKIIAGDILELDLPFEGDFDVVGNFPYNISTEIVFKMLGWAPNVQTITGMFQKEVADRIAAKEGSKTYGVTSALLQAFFSVQYLFTVDAKSFKPPPKVTSAVIRFKALQEIPEMKSRKKYFLLVKTAFNQRRKTLRNATKSLFLPEVLEDPLFNKRAEQLSVADFAALTFKMQ
jgi:16S rRNA (adenine1518-N6/adenine1519-N6)-dimethyltransferase